MTEEQRAEWHRVLVASAKASRRRRARRRRGLEMASGAGMVRISPARLAAGARDDEGRPQQAPSTTAQG
jgi:hypothetical protein